MVSSKEYLDFVLDQLFGLDGITYRAMMDESIIFYQGRIIIGMYDRFFGEAHKIRCGYDAGSKPWTAL